MLAHAPAPSPQRVVRAATVSGVPHTLGRGVRVPARRVGPRTFLGGSFGVALADVGQATYPVQTTDGGRAWRVNGPALFTDTADAPLSVSTLRAVNRRVQFTDGGGGNVIDVTDDGGRVWRRATFDGVPAAVVPGLGTTGPLVAFVQSDRDPRDATTYEYVSRDGGQTWRRSTVLGGG